MSEDKPKAMLGDPDGPDDVLRRAAREIRASNRLEAFVPLSAAEREQLADAAIERALGAPAEPEPVSRPASSGAAASATWRRPRFRARSAAIVASALALAAAIALVVRGRSVEPPLAYSMVVEGEQDARGVEPTGPRDAPVELHPETRLAITLTAGRPERDVLLRLVLVRDGRATLLDPPILRSKAGTLVIEGPAGELLGAQTDGRAELVVVLGREPPGDDEVRALALSAAAEVPRRLQVMRRVVVLEGFSQGAVEVLLGGCRAVIEPRAAVAAARSTCEVTPGARLQLWVGTPVMAPVVVAMDGRAIERNPESRGGGSAFELELAAPAGVLSVHIGDQEIAAWQIAPASSFEAIRAADEALSAQQLDRAAAALDTVSSEAAPEEQLEATVLRAKIAFRRSELGQERQLHDQAVRQARALGRVSVEIDQTVAILYRLWNQHALAQAVQLLPALDAHGTIYAEGTVLREWVHGLFASELGELGAALGSFQRALALADRIADTRDRDALPALLADVLQTLGRDSEAAVIIDAEIQRAGHSTDPCRRVEALTSTGWLLRDRDRPRAQPLVDQAVELATQRCEREVAIALVNQGWLLAAARRFGDARAILDRLAGVRARDARVTTWALRLEAEVLLGEDPEKAEQYGGHLAARAAALCSSELAYEAHLLRARALVALDRPEQAAEAFAAAERALTLWSKLVPLGEGRAAFFARHDQLVLAAIAFFLEPARRDTPAARLALATTVRHSIARFIASLAGAGRERTRAERGETTRDLVSEQFERIPERWSAGRRTSDEPGKPVAVCEARDAAARTEDLPLTELPAHPALFVHPAPQGLLVLAWSGSSIDFREIPGARADERADELAARIASAAAPMLAGAPRIELHVHRALVGLPLDRSLAARLHVPIAFAVDAPSRSGPVCHAAPRALLVANPQRNLWAASHSVRAIQADLVRMGFQVDPLEGAKATRAAIEERLADPCTALFQYEGHGTTAARHEASGAGERTRDRIDDALLLAGGDTLTAGDILGLPRVPDKVVLNGCTTAAPEGLGLAQAFVLAGASQVIASLDELPADAAARFTAKLFEGARPVAAGVDLVGLFTRAIAGADVPALRAYER